MRHCGPTALATLLGDIATGQIKDERYQDGDNAAIEFDRRAGKNGAKRELCP